MHPPPAANTHTRILKSKQLKWIGRLAFAGLAWKSFSQRSPWFLIPDVPALVTPNTCTVYHPTLLPFCEDYATIPDSPLLILSCDPARREWSHLVNKLPASLPAGELHLYNPQTPSELPIKLYNPVSDFRPLGISSVRLPSGKARVFVTNQAIKGPRVEIFDVDLPTGIAEHKATISHALITSPNSIAAISPAGFYLTNDLYFSRKSVAGAALELLSGVAGGTLVYVSLTPELAPNATQISRLAFANGLDVDTASGKLWAAGVLTGLYEYEWDLLDPARIQAVTYVRSAVLLDNVVFSRATGGVYASGITGVRGFFGSAKSEGAPAPASLTALLLPRMAPAGYNEESVDAAPREFDLANMPLRKEEWRWESVFVDDGTLFGGITTGAVLDNGRYVGVSLLARGVVVCEEAPLRKVPASKTGEKAEKAEETVEEVEKVEKVEEKVEGKDEL